MPGWCGRIVPTVDKVAVGICPVIAICRHVDDAARSDLDILGEFQFRAVEELQNAANGSISVSSAFSKNAEPRYFPIIHQSLTD